MRISDWSSDVCSSDLIWGGGGGGIAGAFGVAAAAIETGQASAVVVFRTLVQADSGRLSGAVMRHHLNDHLLGAGLISPAQPCALRAQRMFEHHQVPLSVAEELVRASYYHGARNPNAVSRSEEHTSELQSLMRISYAV